MKVDSQPKGLVFSVDRNVVEDGPGIRTTVFLKGCPLRCVWCHSPQSQSKEQQLLFIENRCIGCGACVEVCPKDAQEISGTGRRILWERCDDCGECARVCPSHGIGNGRRVDDGRADHGCRPERHCLLQEHRRGRNVFGRGGSGATRVPHCVPREMQAGGDSHGRGYEWICERVCLRENPAIYGSLSV